MRCIDNIIITFSFSKVNTMAGNEQYLETPTEFPNDVENNVSSRKFSLDFQ